MTKVEIVKYGMLVVLALCVALVVWKWQDWRATAHAGSAYAARITCSCRYIAGRSAASCAQDIVADASMVRITEDANARRISGHVPLLGSASARFTQGFGCLMEP
jgi:hypothetical protein